MKILVTGATGFIGRAVVARLHAEGHSVTAMTRNVQRARRSFPQGIDVVDNADIERAVEGADAVVHFAGEPIAQRWTTSAKARIRESRVEGTRRLVEAIRRADAKPKVLVSGSAVGYYGERGDEVVTESSSPASDFLASVCTEWEGEAFEASGAGVRVVVLRTGIVFGRGGGLLDKLSLPLKMGIAPRIVEPSAWVAWIHLDDFVRLVVRALGDDAFEGAYNAVAPNPATGTQLAAALRQATGGWMAAGAPKSIARLVAGEVAVALGGSQRVVPERALATGFTFQHQDVAAALTDVFDGSSS